MRIFSLDIETKDPGIGNETGSSSHRPSDGGYPFMVGLKEFDHACQILRWEESTTLLQDLFEEGCHFVGANLKYDLDWLIHAGVMKRHHAKYNRFSDILVNASLLDNTLHPSHYSLDGQCRHYGLDTKPKQMLVNAALQMGLKANEKTVMGMLWQLPWDIVAQYLRHDLVQTEIVWWAQQKHLKDARLTEVWPGAPMSVVELEEKLLPVLALMECQGVRIDVEAAEKLADAIGPKIAEIRENLRQENEGEEVNLNHSKSLTKFLLGRGHTLPNTEKGNASTSSEVLNQLAQTDPIIGDILIARRAHKIEKDFCRKAVLEMAVNGRIHPTINQTFTQKFEGRDKEGKGVRFGRLSMTEPNLQQVPKKDKVGFDDTGGLGTAMRRLFIAENGCQLLAADFAAQEPRWAIHWAESWGIFGAKEAGDRYRENHRISPHDIVASGISAAHLSAKEKRNLAKVINLGKSYEMGFNKLVANLVAAGCDTKQAKRILEEYEETFPYLSLASKKAKQVCEELGYVRTFFGRKALFSLWEPRYGYGEPLPYEEALQKYVHGPKRSPIVRSKTYRAFNRVVQGSSADQVKYVMVCLFYERDILPTSQIHDELVDAAISEESQIRTYREVMEHCLTLTVPHYAEISVGPNWAEGQIWEGAV